MEEKVKLIRKLRLKTGCKYIIFMPADCISSEDVEAFREAMGKIKCGGIIVIVQDTKKIKVVERI